MSASEIAPELEERFGARIDRAVDKVSGLLPVEWSVELRGVIRGLVAEAHAAGAAHPLRESDPPA